MPKTISLSDSQNRQTLTYKKEGKGIREIARILG
jgi:hypothetical protein